ncbi:uncharacterized protein LOC129718490 isoform X3 [Wyeomyia smithii]|nr:uncharacterized protein LOC129718490 isoform X3 [Wyeomyia smithii]
MSNPYDVVCCPRTNRAGGGACIFVHQSLQYDVMKNEEFLEGSSIIIYLREPRVKVAVIYRPPHASLNDTINYLDALLECNSKLLCVGDFNIDLLSELSRSYVSMVESNGFAFFNKVDSEYATRRSNTSRTIIDHAITDLYCQKYSICLDDLCFTDHKSILISFGLIRSKKGNVEKQIIKYSFDRISLELAQSVNTTESLESLTALIHDTMARNSFIVHSRNRHRGKPPWIDDHVLREIQLRNQLYQRTIQWPSNHVIQQNFKRQKHYVTRIIKQKQKLYDQNLIAQNRSNIKKVWNILNEIVFHRNTEVRQNAISEVIIDETTLKNETDICNAFSSYFINLPSKLSKDLLRMFNNEPKSRTLHTVVQNSIVILPANEICNYVHSLKNSNAVGIDGISSKFIKNNIAILSSRLTDLFNQAIEEGVFPECLKAAKVVPIHKKGQKSNISNYRPISILPTLSKPFEKLIEQRLRSFLNRNKIIHSNQYGFQPNSNTTSAIVNIINTIQQNIDQRKMCSTIFIDVSKAFDCVHHSILLSKLGSYGIRNNALELFKTYLTGRKQRVIIGNHTSSDLTVKFGVPQGSVLGPLLFNVLSMTSLSFH